MFRALPFLFLTGFWALVIPLRGEETVKPRNLIVVLDASGSMWGQIGGANKIVIAKRVLGEVIDQLPADSRVGLVVYGHRDKGDCGDIETLAPLSPLDAAALKAQIESLHPKGKTPITDSLRAALKLAPAEESATVILISDGLETCGGDPCALVKQAAAGDAKLVVHVVGFGLSEDNLSQLECTAQAGNGLYFSADDAAGLAAALDQAVAQAEIPDSRLSLKAVANGEPLDASVVVVDKASGEEVSASRTYTGHETNPRVLPLPAGNYRVRVRAVTIRGAPEKVFEDVVVEEGQTTERVADFSTGELAVKVTRNGPLSDATVGVYLAGTKKRVAGGRTYTGERSNPKIFRLPAGTYDVAVGSVEIAGNPEHRWTDVKVGPDKRAELAHVFESGLLVVGAKQGETLVDAAVIVQDVKTGKEVDRARTYAHANSNPKRMTLPPGFYKVTVKPIKPKGDPQSVELELAVGKTLEHIFQLP